MISETFVSIPPHELAEGSQMFKSIELLLMVVRLFHGDGSLALPPHGASKLMT